MTAEMMHQRALIEAYLLNRSASQKAHEDKGSARIAAGGRRRAAPAPHQPQPRWGCLRTESNKSAGSCLPSGLKLRSLGGAWTNEHASVANGSYTGRASNKALSMRSCCHA